MCGVPSAATVIYVAEPEDAAPRAVRRLTYREACDWTSRHEVIRHEPRSGSVGPCGVSSPGAAPSWARSHCASDREPSLDHPGRSAFRHDCWSRHQRHSPDVGRSTYIPARRCRVARLRTVSRRGDAHCRVPRQRGMPQRHRGAEPCDFLPRLVGLPTPKGPNPGASRGKCRPHRMVGIAIVPIEGVPSEVDVEAAPIRSGHLPVIELVDVVPEIPRRQVHQLIKSNSVSLSGPPASQSSIGQGSVRAGA